MALAHHEDRNNFEVFIILAAFLSGAIVGAFGFYSATYEDMQKGFRLLKDAYFVEQVSSIKGLQEGSQEEALKYLRAMNDHSIRLLYANSTDSLDIEFLKKETVEFACKDLQLNPQSWFTSPDQSREDLKPACAHLLKLFDEKE